MKKLAIERWKNDEYRQKVIANRTGIKQSHETVQKRVLKTKGQKRSPEQIARYKKAAKLRSQDPIYKKKLIKGIIEKKAKKVAYIDNDNNVIKVFNSIVECSKYCNITPKYISMVCNGIQEKAKGLKFKFI